MELVMLAHTYDGKKPLPAGTLMSEKLDGLRCTWVPGTIGRYAKEIPSANLHKEKNPDKIISTGLWSRGGKVIHAPKWWIAQLPPYNLDGELWVARQSFHLIESIAMGSAEKVSNDPRWQSVKYVIYGSPSHESLYMPRKIKVRNELVCLESDWANVPREIKYGSMSINPNIYNHQKILKLLESEFKVVDPDNITSAERGPVVLKQFNIDEYDRGEFMDRVLRDGGEGVMYVLPNLMWEPVRSHRLLKEKPFLDAEGVVIGCSGGKDANEGKVGALRVLYNGKEFDLSGLTQKERELMPESVELAKLAPGKYEPLLTAKHFRVGQVITFKYRELTPYGIPKEARYWRNPSKGD